MSTIIMSACWPLQGMSAAQKAVLISLADQSNDDGVCWPGVGTIARRTCLSERAVQEALSWLQKVGLVFREYRLNASTSYTITPGSFDPTKAPVGRRRSKAGGADGAPPADSAPPASGAPGGEPGAPVPPHQAHPRGEPGAPKSSLNRHRNHQRTNTPALERAGPVAQPEDVTDQTWADWLQLRKVKRAPVTETVLKGAKAEAAKACMTLEAFLQLWCIRGSQGLQAAWLRPAAAPSPGRAPAFNANKHAAAAATIFDGVWDA